MSEAITYFDEVREIVQEMGGQDITLCKQCGLCSGSCPWGRMEKESPFSIRQMIYMGRLGLEGFESDDVLYACTTCGQCVVRCPRGVKIIDVVRAMRSVVCETGGIPKNLKAVLGSINSNSNPWSQDSEKRIDWTKGLDIPTYTDQEYLLYVCCTSAFDGRSQKIARAIATTLQKAGISFGIIGTEEKCCGEAVRKIGAEEEFSNLAEANIELFNSKGVKKIITTSPHCYYTFKNEYPEFGGEFEVIHYTQLFAELLKEGKLKPAKGLGKKVIYHEPCYLGRHSKVFEAPRELLTSIPEVECMEFDKTKDDSMCCSGGGARIWMETEAGLRFSDVKAKEAMAKGADLVVTACPYCIVMLEDSLKNIDKDETMAVKDISELISDSLE
ncbi:(Fe-S)-binding protein [Desulfoscipio geothermicus]|uniref:Fe-S oxidoreductase n=1 Tax=Desulfoscipio geothermicus DSM 3669 TaxID=1121426 RepID=A0A1I6D4V0_9FIRM|nr:(Fe-S)-binding protein [Desulfoscipio geothermicus]SFR00327.1 Fe-S oxidoreductase [Desulfoscipio geothermicus DSM 3669]